MKKILLLIILLTQNVFADSPLTSTDFFNLVSVIVSVIVIFWLIRLYIKSEIIPLFDYKLKNNKSYLLNRIRKEPSLFRFTSRQFKGDKEVVLTYLDACIQNGKNTYRGFDKISCHLLNDKEVALKAVKVDGNCFGYLSWNLRDDKEVVLEAVKRNGLALEFASIKMKNDDEIISEALKNDKDAIKYISSK